MRDKHSHEVYSSFQFEQSSVELIRQRIACRCHVPTLSRLVSHPQGRRVSNVLYFRRVRSTDEHDAGRRPEYASWIANR